MSTKNMARTAIEGGRYFGVTFRCRYEHGAARTSARTALARLAASDADDLVVPPLRKLGRQFRDKLSVPERWLDAQIGRPWRLVRSELVRKFDSRTTAGRHILFDHMLAWVRVGKAACDGGELFAVDRHGLLRRLPRRAFWRREPPGPLPRPEHELSAWLNGRCVGARGDLLFWFVPTAHDHFRQHHLLDERDAALWRSLPAWYRKCHDRFATRTNHTQ